VRKLSYLVLALVVLAGLTLRFNQYTKSTSFWKDEVFLAQNLLTHDFAELHKPLDNTQAAPVGFLHLSKLIELNLGHTEKTLWLISMLSSIALLLGAAALMVRALGLRDGTIGTAIIALSSALIIYSTQLKPYLSDALISMGLLAAFLWVRTKPNWRGHLLWLCASVVALYFSYTAVFVIAGLGLWLIGEALATQKQKTALGWLINNGALAIIFGLLWVNLYSQLDTDGAFKEFWAHAMLPWNSQALEWLWINPQTSLTFIFSGVAPIVVLVTILVAVGALWQNKRHWLAVSLPVGLTYIAAAAHAYPVEGRLILFWIPLLTPLIAVGIGRIY